MISAPKTHPARTIPVVSDRVQKTLDDFRAVRWRVGLTTVALRSLAVFAVLAAVCMTLDMLFGWLSATPRWVGWMVTVGATIFVGTKSLLTLIFSQRRQPRVAAAADDAAPELEERLQTVAYFAANDRLDGRTDDRMLGQVVREADRMAASVIPSQIVDRSGYRRPAMVLALVGGIACLSWAVWPRDTNILAGRFAMPWCDWTRTTLINPLEPSVVGEGESWRFDATLGGRVVRSWRLEERPVDSQSEGEPITLFRTTEGADRSTLRYTHAAVNESFEYRITAGDYQSDWTSVTVASRPQLVDASVRVTPPEYTGRKPREIAGWPREVKALEGSLLDFAVKIDVPDSQAELKLTTGKKRSTVGTRTLLRDAGGVYRGTVRLDQTQVVTLRMIEPHGLENARQYTTRLVAIKDRAPQVKIESPSPNTVVRPDDEITITFTARDDVEVKYAELVVTETDTESGEQTVRSVVPIELPDQKNRRQMRASVDLDLSQFDLKTGDQLDYQIRVLDSKQYAEATSLPDAAPLPTTPRPNSSPASPPSSSGEDQSADEKTVASERTGDSPNDSSSTTSEPTTSSPNENGRVSDSNTPPAQPAAESTVTNSDEPRPEPAEPSETMSANSPATASPASSEQTAPAEKQTPSPSPAATASDSAAKSSNDDSEASPQQSPSSSAATASNNVSPESMPTDGSQSTSQPAESNTDNRKLIAGQDMPEITPNDITGSNDVTDAATSDSMPPADTAESAEMGPANSSADTADAEMPADSPSGESSESAANDSTSNSPSPSQSSGSSSPQDSPQSSSSNNRQPSSLSPPPTEEPAQAGEVSRPPSDDNMTRRMFDAASSTSSRSMRLRIDENAGSFAGEARRKVEMAIQPVLGDLEKWLTASVQLDAGVTASLEKGAPWGTSENESVTRSVGYLDRSLKRVREFGDKAADTPYAFVGLQLSDIMLNQVASARADLLGSLKAAEGSRQPLVTSAKTDTEFALRRLATLRDEFTREKREQTVADKIEEIERMYQVFVEDAMAALGQSNSPLNNYQRSMAEVEADEEYLRRLQEILQMREMLRAELARILSEDPRLLRRFTQMYVNRAETLRDQLTMLHRRQTQLVIATTAQNEVVGDEVAPAIWDQHWKNGLEVSEQMHGIADRFDTWLPLTEAEQNDPNVVHVAEQFKQASITAAEFRDRIQKHLSNTPSSEGGSSDYREAVADVRDALIELGSVSESTELSDNVLNRLVELDQLNERLTAWSVQQNAFEQGDVGAALAVDQYRLTTDTSRLADKLATLEQELANVLQSPDQTLPKDIAKKTRAMLRKLDDDVGSSQLAATYALRKRDIPKGQQRARAADESLEEVEVAFDELVASVIELADDLPPGDPLAELLDDPTLEEILQQLEREASLAEQLGIPGRPNNIQIIRDWTTPSSQPNGSGNNGNGSRANVVAKSLKQSEEERRRRMQQYRQRLRKTPRPDITFDRRRLLGSGPRDRWGSLVSELENGLLQDNADNIPEQYRRAIERYFDTIGQEQP